MKMKHHNSGCRIFLFSDKKYTCVIYYFISFAIALERENIAQLKVTKFYASVFPWDFSLVALTFYIKA